MKIEPEESMDIKGKQKMERVFTKSKDHLSFHTSIPFQCPSSNAVLQQQQQQYLQHERTAAHSFPFFQLIVRQDPIKGFSAGTDIMARKNARITPLDPPPICELVVLPFSEEDELDDMERAKYLSTVEVCIHVRLVNANEPFDELQDRKLDPNGILLAGNLVESPFIAPCTPPGYKDECFFVFSELSVKCSGRYRLCYDLIDRSMLRFRKIVSVIGEPFTVYSTKKNFGDFIESSALVKEIVARGLRLRITRGYGKRSDGSEEEQQQQQHMSKKRRSLIDHNLAHFTNKFSSRPRAISDSIDQKHSLVEGIDSEKNIAKRIRKPSYDFFEKPLLPPIPSKSSNSRSIQRRDEANEAFYPRPNYLLGPSPESDEIWPHKSLPFRAKVETSEDHYENHWIKSRDQEDRRISSPNLCTSRRMCNGHRHFSKNDYEQRDKAEKRPYYQGHRHHSPERQLPFLRFRSPFSHVYHSHRNDFHPAYEREHDFPRWEKGVERQRFWQDVPTLPPIRSQPNSHVNNFDERQRRRPSDLGDDMTQYAVSKRYDSNQYHTYRANRREE